MNFQLDLPVMNVSAAAYDGANVCAPAIINWNPGDYGPNSAIEHDLAELRRRCRDVSRNNLRAKAAEDQCVINQIGTGIKPKLLIEDEELAEKVMNLAEMAFQLLDTDGQHFFQTQETVARSVFTSGEILARRVYRAPTLSNPLPIGVQLLEADHLDTRTNKDFTRSRVRMGIELNKKTNARLRYHIRRSHPGDSGSFSNKTVAVRANDIAHVYKVLRPGQLRGVPKLAPGLTVLRQLDDFEHATLERVKLASLFVGFITNSSGELDLEKMFGKVGFVEGRNNHYAQMGSVKPGTMTVGVPGDEMKFNTPPDVGQMFQPNVHNWLRALAALAGITFEQMTGFMKDVNFSSARIRLIDIRRGFGMDQVMFARGYCNPVWQWLISAFEAMGEIKIPTDARQRWLLFNPQWIADPFDYVHPVDEIEANELLVRNQVKSLDTWRTERGEDPRSLEREIVKTNQRHDELKIISDADPRKVQRSGTRQPTQEED